MSWKVCHNILMKTITRLQQKNKSDCVAALPSSLPRPTMASAQRQAAATWPEKPLWSDTGPETVPGGPQAVAGPPRYIECLPLGHPAHLTSPSDFAKITPSHPSRFSPGPPALQSLFHLLHPHPPPLAPGGYITCGLHTLGSSVTAFSTLHVTAGSSSLPIGP